MRTAAPRRRDSARLPRRGDRRHPCSSARRCTVTAGQPGDGPRAPAARRRRVRVVPGGPVLVEGPVDVVGADGEQTPCDRFVVALCVCGGSRTPPLCDSSHRRRRSRRRRER
ncbi:CDGSH iron-sulfur domain-containing protein [Tsukamurella ocularis]|uniref:CDGSH iron-sulfur domain-containing protein n=1 Tax=Tsukamurella ocularis TaxID=1970234 RepID=UPI0039F0889F